MKRLQITGPGSERPQEELTRLRTEVSLLHGRIAELEETAQVDALTGLPNRGWLDRALPHLLKQYPGEVGLVFLDIDGLKEANDAYGHAQGDELIRNTGKIIYESLRNETKDPEDGEKRQVKVNLPDLLSRGVTRYAGDEFVTVLLGVRSHEEVDAVSQRIELNLAREGIQASMGGLIHTDEGAGELLEKADALMYVAKLKRKSESYTPEQREVIKQLGALAAENEINLRDVPILLSFLEQEITA